MKSGPVLFTCIFIASAGRRPKKLPIGPISLVFRGSGEVSAAMAENRVHGDQ